MSWLLGDLFLTSTKAQHTFSNKFILLKVFKDDFILYNIIGYLAADQRWRKSFLEVGINRVTFTYFFFDFEITLISEFYNVHKVCLTQTFNFTSTIDLLNV